MADISLHHSTGNTDVDEILRQIIQVYETAFPSYIRAYYVIGSYADNSYIPLSDIDFSIIFGKPVTREQLNRAWTLAEECASLSDIRLDIGMELQSRLEGYFCAPLKFGSLLVYGTDIRDEIALPTMAQYQKYVTWGPYRFLGQVVRGVELLRYPLTYPAATDQFYGYAQKRIDAWYPATITQGTKEIVTGITRTATSLVALKAQRYVGTKAASVQLYRQHINDEWTDFLEAWYQKGKLEWHYGIPKQAKDQEELHDLCRQTLAFENYYFQQYRDYLFGLLDESEEMQRFAVERLRQVCYSDDDIITQLRRLTESPTVSDPVREAATQALTYAEMYR